jgi:hypothetical protein
MSYEYLPSAKKEEEMVTETEIEVADLDRNIILYIPIF